MLMNAADNVVTTVAEVAKDEEVVFRKDGKFLTIRVEEDIPYCHKVALKDLPQGSEVIKYGESLGRTVAGINKGCWVNDQNLKSELRDYDSELADDDWQMCATQSEGDRERKTFQFWGYRRAEGRPGIRNHILILPTCVCASESCDIASVTSMVASGCQAIVFTTGRGTPTGNAIAPVLKVTANERTYRMMEDNMDVDLSAVLRGERTIVQMGSELVDIVAEVASGRMTKAEAFGFSDIAVDHVCRFV